MDAPEPQLPVARRWWEELAEDFHRRPALSGLDVLKPFKIAAAAAGDHLLRLGFGSMVATAALPTLFSTQAFRRDMAAWPHYRALADAGDVDTVFPAPPAEVQVSVLPASRLGWHPGGDIDCRRLRFTSPFRTGHPGLRERYAAARANARACAQHWTHRDGPRPTLIVIHGYAADPHWFNSWLLDLRGFHRAGYDILLYTLPFHGARCEHFDPFSGYRFVAGGYSMMNEAMAQAVHDLRIFIDYLQAQGVPQVGVTGYSLGGYTAALLAAVERRLAFCIPNSPLVSPVDVARALPPLGAVMDVVLRRHGLSLAQLRHAIACHSPLSYAPRIDPERLLIIGGAGDRFVSPQQLQLLHLHWRGSRLHWFPGNHLLHLEQRRYLRKMREFMDACCGR